MSIVNECMIANLSIGMWAAQKLDKEASRKVTEDAGAVADAGNFNKHLVSKDALKPIISAANAIRTHFYTYTLPWKDNGDRLLTRKGYMKFIDEHEDLIRSFNSAVEDFLTRVYPEARARAEFRMGDLFDPNDYPPVYALRHRFYARMEIDAVVEAGDFRVEMDEDHLDRIRGDMERAMTSRLGAAMGDVWERLRDTLQHLHNKLKVDDQGNKEVFRDSTVTNLEEIVELLPSLNITNDPNLERIRADIEASIIGYTPKQLRKSEEVRASVSEDAQRILEDLSGFMTMFKGKE